MISTSTIRDLANPTRFMSLSGRLLPWIGAGAILVMAAGLYLAFFVAPADYQQGETVRIMYVHVPAAWLGLFFYVAMAASALGTLVWRHPLAEVSQRAAAPIGAAFTLVCLVTGSLWGKPMWGTYWVWDARLTSMLVLFLIYCGILALWHAIEEPGRASRAVSILTLVGAVNIPIVKFSVDWWNTLHQPASVFRMGGSAIHPSILWPLLVMATAFTLLGVALHLSGMRTEILRRRVRTLTILEAERLDADPATGLRPTRGGRTGGRLTMNPHTAFIAAAYGFTALVAIGLVLRAVLDHRAQVRALASLEARGLRRRPRRG